MAEAGCQNALKFERLPEIQDDTLGAKNRNFHFRDNIKIDLSVKSDYHFLGGTLSSCSVRDKVDSCP